MAKSIRKPVYRLCTYSRKHNRFIKNKRTRQIRRVQKRLDIFLHEDTFNISKYLFLNRRKTWEDKNKKLLGEKLTADWQVKIGRK